MSKPKAPKPVDYQDAARQGVYAGLETYPTQYLVDAAARTGDKVTIDGKTYDFTGLGDAATAGAVSDKMAQTLLDIQRSLGPRQIQERIDELKASDPEGYAARQQLFDRIMADANAQPDRPLAEDVQNQITSILNNAGKLDARGREQVSGQVRGGQIHNGIYLGNAATEQEAGAQVAAADNLRNQQQQEAMQFLQSGASPEDVAYRRLQQSIADLGNFTNGATPTAEFGSLSSAGNGAVPFIGGGPGPMPANLGNLGASFNQNLYSGQVNWAQNQVNPWIAGISTGVSGLNALAGAYPAGASGWSPWAATATASMPTGGGATNPWSVSGWSPAGDYNQPTGTWG